MSDLATHRPDVLGHRAHWLRRIKQSCPPWVTLLLFLPLQYLMLLVTQDPCLSVITGALPIYVLKGKLFTEPFNIVHAGFCLDQPTIGKWLFWFVVMTFIAIPVMLLARWLGNRRSRWGYWVFAVPTAIMTLQLGCVLLWPLCMLVQYTYSMGITPKRLFGLFFCSLAFGFLGLFLRWALRPPAKSSKSMSEP
jgi:hypothetical protein